MMRGTLCFLIVVFMLHTIEGILVSDLRKAVAQTDIGVQGTESNACSHNRPSKGRS